MSDGPNTNMNEELRKLLEDVKRYIERMEVQIDGEWGSCREVEELQEQDLMPELYAHVNAALANVDSGRATADNMKCEICGNNHHPMTECRDTLCSLVSAACPPSSLTPETDALADEIYARGIRVSEIRVSEIRMLQHTRTMEKERNMARATANTFRQCAEITFGPMPFPRKFHWENRPR